MAHRLENASSLYLRQHAHQQVDWWPYGSEPFAQARQLDRPVMLSIGYAACHWCHVMSHESFDDPRIAAYLNEHFVSIKVDREQHPLVDDTYMLATQAMTGAGGWPMTVFALPDGRAFHAGTYYPPTARGRVPSFTQVLAAVHEAYTQRRDGVDQQAAALAEHLAELGGQQHQMMKYVPQDESEGDALADAVAGWISSTRPEGGFTPAPKFPPSQSLQVLWRHVLTAPDPDAAFDAAATTTEAMLLGGLHDHVNGGFARYCVDEHWSVPHFEKMLYDNAQLLRLAVSVAEVCTHYAAGADGPHRARATALAEASRRAARGIVHWLRESMLTGQPGDRHRALAASRDADAPRDGTAVEGAAYTLTRDQLAGLTARLSGPLPPHLVRLAEVAEDPGHHCLSLSRMPQGEEWAVWEELLALVRELYAARQQPARDAKVVAGWNGMAIEALCQAAVLLDDPGCRQLAEQVAHAVWNAHFDAESGRLARVSFYGQADHGNEGTLEDYAGLALGLGALSEADPDGPWEHRAGLLLERAQEFVDDEGLARDAVALDETLAAQRGQLPAASAMDDAIPAAASLLARALAQRAVRSMARECEEGQVERDLQAAQQLIGHAAVIAARFPSAVAGALEVRALLDAPVQYLRAAGGEPAQQRELERLAAALGLPLAAAGSEQPAGPAGALRIYPCRHTSCRAPVQSPAQLLRQLGAR